MAILAQCPLCRKKQSIKNKKCKCGQSLDAAKKAQKVRYWIDYQLPNGKARRESVDAFEGLNGYSLDDARSAMSKRHVQKKENRIFDMLPESKVTFQELADWYLKLKSVWKLSSYSRVKQAINKFNETFGSRIVGEVLPVDLEDYQQMRLDEGRAFATIDMEVKITQTMVTKAFDNDKVSGDALKAFRKVKRLLKKGSNARKTTISIQQYLGLLDNSPAHLKAVLIIAFNTAMRKGEIRSLRWEHIDRKNMMIRLPAKLTKEKRDKDIPINHHVKAVLDNLPRAINGYVVTYQGKQLTQKDSFKRSLGSACKKAGVLYGRKIKGGITFHDIRRTVKTNMVNAGVDKAYRDTILGHSLEGMDAHYVVPNDKTLTEAIEKYTAWIDGEVKKTNLDQSLDQIHKTN